jgi:hypothetical protein
MALGGILGNLVLPPLAAALGTEAGFLAVAVVVLVGAAGCLRLPRAQPAGNAGSHAPVAEEAGPLVEAGGGTLTPRVLGGAPEAGRG